MHKASSVITNRRCGRSRGVRPWCDGRDLRLLHLRRPLRVLQPLDLRAHAPELLADLLDLVEQLPDGVVRPHRLAEEGGRAGGVEACRGRYPQRRLTGDRPVGDLGRKLHLEVVHALPEVLPQVHDVAHGGKIPSPQAQDHLQELGEAQALLLRRVDGALGLAELGPAVARRQAVGLLEVARRVGVHRGALALEEDPLKGEQVLGVHAKALQDHVHLRVPHEQLEVILVDVAVVILVVHLEDLYQVVLQVGYRRLLLLALVHLGGHFAENANKHVENREVAEENEDHKDERQDPGDVHQLEDDVRHSI
mmetsp:Transcript_18416/g.50001  ORF Transcript_18416/g.50001 Transcript_18416/m.50001 type:complete len:308 (-) Transcript_18416:330-1253(-)